jgi:hypothetical protein
MLMIRAAYWASLPSMNIVIQQPTRNIGGAGIRRGSTEISPSNPFPITR